MSIDQARRLRNVWIKFLVLPLIIITLILIFATRVTVPAIHNHYSSQVIDKAHRLAQSHSLSVSKSLGAEQIISNMLEEKLLSARESTALNAQITNNTQLQSLSKSLRIDEINIYNSDGTIDFSTTPSLIGGTTYEGHPVYSFLNNGSVYMIEDIRANVVTGKYYKYGYFKSYTGTVVQIGYSADDFLTFTEAFSTRQLVHEITEATDVLFAAFILPDLTINASSQKNEEESLLERDETIDAVKNQKEAGFQFLNGGDPAYDVYTPVIVNGDHEGTLVVRYDMTLAYGTSKIYTQFALSTAVLTYLVLFIFVLISYTKNKKLVHLAYHDEKTGLPNLSHLKEYLIEIMSGPKKPGHAVSIIGFNDFESANLKYGYDQGDEILIYAGNTIKTLETDKIHCFRFTDEKFALLTDRIDESGLKELYERIMAKFELPYPIGDDRYYLAPQIGCYQLNFLESNPEQVLKFARIAVTAVKNNQTHFSAFYNENMKLALHREEAIEAELREIIETYDSDRLFLNFQPQLDLRTCTVHGFEALARMNSSIFGSVSPVEFIKIAENKKLIIPLGEMILRQACIFLTTLYRLGYKDMTVAVNISVLQLLDEGFINLILKTLHDTGTCPKNLEIEITESIVADNFMMINSKLRDLEKIGISTLLDDFGTGYSSFLRLSELNISSLKIDQYFIGKITSLEHNEFITENIIDMAHKIGLKVVAEGVEHLVQKEYLSGAKCDIIQGYLYSKPLAEHKVFEFLSNANKATKKEATPCD